MGGVSIPSNAQGLILTLHLGSLLTVLKMPGIMPKSDMCKARTLLAVLLLHPPCIQMFN